MNHLAAKTTALLLCVLCISCKRAAVVDVDRVVERVDAPAPALPPVCEDRKHGASARPTPLEPVEVEVLIFSSDWCDACDRVLAEFSARADEFSARGVRVRHLITQSDGSCVRAATVGRRAPFVYHALDSAGEARWAIRSTPTLWVTHRDRARLYIEGEISAGELLEILPVE